MPEQDPMSTSLQENLLTLVCFNEKVAPSIIHSVNLDLYDSSYYREIAGKAYDFYNRYKKIIGDHLGDEMETTLKSKDKRKVEIYEEILINIRDLSQSINEEYVMNQLHKFIRQQNLKLGITQAVDFISAGKIDEAEAALERGRESRINLFDVGTRLTDTGKILKALETLDNYHHIGIDELDKLGICPAPKELYVIVALAGHGKSWFLIHMAKNFLLQRKKVLHVTLEMSEEKIGLRYLQSLFSIAKDKELARLTNSVFDNDDKGFFSNLNFDTLSEVKDFKDQNITKYIEKRMRGYNKTQRFSQLIIKEFPTSTLTINQLKAYLDNLESFYNWIPDILMVDYADLMAINTENLRADTGRIYKELRGIGVERNFSVVTPSQANRSGERVELLTRENLSEDFSKVMIADNVITYNQTATEYERGLARLYVDKGRNDRKGDIILLAQNYSIGQFCLKSKRIKGNYWDLVKPHGVYKSNTKKFTDSKDDDDKKDEKKK